MAGAAGILSATKPGEAEGSTQQARQQEDAQQASRLSGPVLVGVQAKSGLALCGLRIVPVLTLLSQAREESPPREPMMRPRTPDGAVDNSVSPCSLSANECPSSSLEQDALYEGVKGAIAGRVQRAHAAPADTATSRHDVQVSEAATGSQLTVFFGIRPLLSQIVDRVINKVTGAELYMAVSISGSLSPGVCVLCAANGHHSAASHSNGEGPQEFRPSEHTTAQSSQARGKLADGGLTAKENNAQLLQVLIAPWSHACSLRVVPFLSHLQAENDQAVHLGSCVCSPLLGLADTQCSLQNVRNTSADSLSESDASNGTFIDKAGQEDESDHSHPVAQQYANNGNAGGVHDAHANGHHSCSAGEDGAARDRVDPLQPPPSVFSAAAEAVPEHPGASE